VEHTAALIGLGCNSVVDIGANRGQFSLLVRALFPQAEIIAFEPLPHPGAVYKAVFAADAAVTFYPVAIGPKSELRTMHIAARDDSSSLFPIGQGQSRVFPGTEEIDTISVQVMPLEEAVGEASVESPALLKLDVQGFELEALRGCETILSRFDAIYCECSFIEMYEGQPLADEVIAWLKERNFRLVGIYNVFYDDGGAAVQGDVLFKR